MSKTGLKMNTIELNNLFQPISKTNKLYSRRSASASAINKSSKSRILTAITSKQQKNIHHHLKPTQQNIGINRRSNLSVSKCFSTDKLTFTKIEDTNLFNIRNDRSQSLHNSSQKNYQYKRFPKRQKVIKNSNAAKFFSKDGSCKIIYKIAEENLVKIKLLDPSSFIHQQLKKQIGIFFTQSPLNKKELQKQYFRRSQVKTADRYRQPQRNKAQRLSPWDNNFQQVDFMKLSATIT